MLKLASVVDTGALVKMLWTASLAGVAVTAIFAAALRGATRAFDLTRAGRPAGAVAAGAVGVVGFAAVVAAVAYGVVLMTQK